VRPYLEKRKKSHKKRTGGVAQGIDPEFKPKYYKKKKKRETKGTKLRKEDSEKSPIQLPVGLET
jgi:hypothetical protein